MEILSEERYSNPRPQRIPICKIPGCELTIKNAESTQGNKPSWERVNKRTE